jgi:hypothetical protein
MKLFPCKKYSGRIAALAGAGVLSATTCDATLVTSNNTISVDATVIEFSVLDSTGTASTGTIKDASWTMESFYFCSGLQYETDVSSVSFTDGNVAVSSTVGSSTTFSIDTTQSGTYGYQSISTLGSSSTVYAYLGFKYVNGSDTYYGYVQYVYYSNSGTNTCTLIGYTCNNVAGQAISVSDLTTSVPEPATDAAFLGGVAALAAGLGLARRRMMEQA